MSLLNEDARLKEIKAIHTSGGKAHRADCRVCYLFKVVDDYRRLMGVGDLHEKGLLAVGQELINRDARIKQLEDTVAENSEIERQTLMVPEEQTSDAPLDLVKKVVALARRRYHLEERWEDAHPVGHDVRDVEEIQSELSQVELALDSAIEELEDGETNEG